ncbi:MAG: disulfide reductase, partial [Clostridia bacterium]|nr:disulfide reductase [Clostridia bacterium]
MKVSYYPGCTLRTKAKDLDVYARKVAEALGVTLEEIENWQCCGGAFTTSTDEIATKLSSVRALKEAKAKGQPLLTVCSACHNVIKQTNDAMKNNAEFASKANNYMAEDP